MKKRFMRLSALLLAIITLLLLLPACANSGTPMMTLEADGKTYT